MIFGKDKGHRRWCRPIHAVPSFTAPVFPPASTKLHPTGQLSRRDTSQRASIIYKRCRLNDDHSKDISAFIHLAPVFGSVLAIALLGERLQFFHAVGYLLVLAGITLATRP